MYTKLFAKILDSSIWVEPHPTRIAWITLLAAMDEDGFCQFAGIKNLAMRAVISVEEAKSAVSLLESPDPDSSDPDHEGRRIERVPGGWMVLNAKKYSELAKREHMKEQTRERVRQFRERQHDGLTERISAQDRKCDCCGEPFEEPFSLYVTQDHDHTTGLPRGLICQSCNTCVGWVENGKPLKDKDNTTFAGYISKWKNKHKKTPKKRTCNDSVTPLDVYIDVTKDVKKDSCAEPEQNSGSTHAIAGTLPLNDKTDYPITKEQIAEWSTLYPAVDVKQECRTMKGWLLASPERRKTKRGILRFINSWLAREQDKSRSNGNGQRFDGRPKAQQSQDFIVGEVNAALQELDSRAARDSSGSEGSGNHTAKAAGER